jgi:RNA recognition motif. (a.k.a. RRM, RBD, or RNP domain)
MVTPHEDDLDAFFDEVEQVQQVVVEADGGEEVHRDKPLETSHSDNNKLLDDHDLQPPVVPTMKTNHSGNAVARPRGVVVASAAAAVPATVSTPTTTYPTHPSTRMNVNTTWTNHDRNDQYNSNMGGTPNLPPTTNHMVGPALQLPQHPHIAYSNVVEASNTTHASSVQPPHNNITHTATTTNGNNAHTTTANHHAPHVRTAAGKVWVDATLSDWPQNDYRIFVGNLDPTVTDVQLYQHFQEQYASLHQVRIIRDPKKKNTSLGYGFVSMMDPIECAQALRTLDQSWLGGRPIRIKRSHWKDREL